MYPKLGADLESEIDFEPKYKANGNYYQLNGLIENFPHRL